MKKINRKLIDNYKLDKSEIEDFTKYSVENVKLETIKAFDKYLINGWFITMHFMIMTLFCILMFPIGFMVPGGLIINIIIAMGAITALIFAIMGLGKHRKIIRNAVRNVDLLQITKKWFTYYGIKEEDVYQTDFQSVFPFIGKYRLSPGDAVIERTSPVVAFKQNGIETSLVEIGWKWIRTYTDSKGRTVSKTYRMNQFYTITNGFNESWNSFEVRIKRGKNIFNKKHETLENEEFNKIFKYKYNDPIKLRKALTPAVQEALVEKLQIPSLNYIFSNGILVTTTKSELVGQGFTPFQINLGWGGANEEVIKKSLANDLTGDFLGIMKVIANNHIIYPLYKK